MKQSFDKDRALSRRFQKIEVLEPSEAEAIEILKGLRATTRSITACKYSDEAIEAAVALSARHLKDLHLPDKAIDVIDEAGAAAKLDGRVPRAGEPGVDGSPSPTSSASWPRWRACPCRPCPPTTRPRSRTSRRN